MPIEISEYKAKHEIDLCIKGAKSQAILVLLKDSKMAWTAPEITERCELTSHSTIYTLVKAGKVVKKGSYFALKEHVEKKPNGRS